ncbi:two-component sensor histidine kinase [Sphaerisporangium melleum]|uniref:Two-component sensor histidine kinase n=1 Tax=Sphaerisporangium melleum TaxID=321316 RepID=A0A917R220_9ACTN|nr:sensor histidine kinase [Sphaerisporangium melleum]GGK84895.1 two-component sensor histidine kinase [Sphaerisporangium melleum]GII70471.1 two-component sensor histidine kinase [Sphaerisporangium melleum]
MGRLSSVLTFGGVEGRAPRWRRLMGTSFGLVYLFYPVSDIVSGALTGAKAYWAVAALVAFVACYIATVLSPKGYGEPGRWTHPLLAVFVLMAVVFPLIFQGGWVALPIYATVVMSMALPMRAALAGIAGMAVVVLVDCLVADADGDTVVLLVVEVVTLGVLFISVRNTRVLVNRLHRAQSEVARLAASEERLRIARDLHDLLGHSLSLIVLKSELAGRLAEAGSPDAVREIGDVEQVARSALREVREAVTGYRRRALAEELDSARAALDAAGVTATVRTVGTPLPDALDDLFGWAVREGVTNVVRHARARRCEIAVTHHEGTAGLEVTDDGHGSGPCEPGSGLAGLAERVQAAGGTLDAGASAGGGFHLRVTVPAPVGTPA